MASVQVGDVVPDVSGPDQNGRTVRLADYRGQIVVLFFYPRDGTAVCTKEVCLFRDLHEQFVQNGTVVIGVSGDSEAAHREFAESQRLPYVLVSDAQGTWRKAFDVPKTLGLLPGRATYVIDPDGRVRHITQSALNARLHVQEAQETVNKIRATA